MSASHPHRLLVAVGELRGADFHIAWASDDPDTVLEVLRILLPSTDTLRRIARQKQEDAEDEHTD